MTIFLSSSCTKGRYRLPSESYHRGSRVQQLSDTAAFSMGSIHPSPSGFDTPTDSIRRPIPPTRDGRRTDQRWFQPAPHASVRPTCLMSALPLDEPLQALTCALTADPEMVAISAVVRGWSRETSASVSRSVLIGDAETVFSFSILIVY